MPPAPVPAERWSPGWSEDHPVGYPDDWGYEENPGDDARDGALRRAAGDQAWRAGALPLLRGDPGYGAHLDDDNDGTACEWGEGF